MKTDRTALSARTRTSRGRATTANRTEPSIIKRMISIVAAAALTLTMLPSAAMAAPSGFEGGGFSVENPETVDVSNTAEGVMSAETASSQENPEEPNSDEAAGQEANASDISDDAASLPVGEIINQAMPLQVVAQSESTRSYFLAQTLESTRTVPVVSANLPLDTAASEGPSMPAEGDGSSEEEGGEGSDEPDPDLGIVAAGSTVVGSFEHGGIVYAIEPGGESVAVVAADPAKLPADVVDAATIVLPAETEAGGISYAVSRIADGAFSSMGASVLADEQQDGLSARIVSDTAADASDAEVASADGSAIEDAPVITAIAIPASVSAIEPDAFEGFDALQYAIVSSDNPDYSSYDGCLYAIDPSSLLLIPEGRTGVVRILSQTMTNIESAVSHCTALEGVVLDADRSDTTSGDVEIPLLANANGEEVFLSFADDATDDAPAMEADYSLVVEVDADDTVDVASALGLDGIDDALFATSDTDLQVVDGTVIPTRPGTYAILAKTVHEDAVSYDAMTLEVTGTETSASAELDTDAVLADIDTLAIDETNRAISYATSPDAKSASGQADGEYVLVIPDYGRATGQLATVGNVGTAWWEVTGSSPTASLGTLRIWCAGGSTIASSNFATWGDWTTDVEGAWGRQIVRRAVSAVYMEPGIKAEEDQRLAKRAEEGGAVPLDGITHFDSGMACWFQCMPNLTDVSGAYVPEGVINLDATFQHCTKLESLEGRYGTFVIPSWVTVMHVTFGQTALKTLPTNFRIPSGILSLRATFYRCWQLSYLPEGLTVPEKCSVSHLFGGCPLLNTIPSSFVLTGRQYGAQNTFALWPNYEFKDAGGNILAISPSEPVVTYYSGDLKNLDPVTEASTATVSHAVSTFASWNRKLIGKDGLAANDLWAVNFVVPTFDGNSNVLNYTVTTKKSGTLEVPYASVPAGSSRSWVYFKGGQEIAENQMEFESGVTPVSDLYFNGNRTANVYLVVVPENPDAKAPSAIAEGEGYVLYIRGYGRATGQLTTVGNVGTAWWEVTSTSPAAGFGTLRIWCEGGSTIASSNFATWGDYTTDVEGAWGRQIVRRAVTAVLMEPGIKVEEDPGLAKRTEEGGKVPPNGITLFGSGMACWFQCMSNLTDVSGAYVPEGVMNLGAAFQQCTKLESLEGRYGTFTIPSWVTTTHTMFSMCALKTLPVNFEIPSSILSLRATFYRCWQLSYLPEGFTVPESASVPYMFAYCSSLEAIPASFVVSGNKYGGDNLFLVVPNYEYKDAEGNLLATAPSQPVVTYYGGDLANLDPVTDTSTATASHAVSTFAIWKRTLIGKDGLAANDLWTVNFVVPTFDGSSNVLNYTVTTKKSGTLEVPYASVPAGSSRSWVYFKDGQEIAENQTEFVSGVTPVNDLYFNANRAANVYLVVVPENPDAKAPSAIAEGEGYVLYIRGYGRATGQLATVGNVGKAWWEVTSTSPAAGFGTLRIWCEGGSTIASSNFAKWGDWTTDVEGAWGRQIVRRAVTAVLMEPGIKIEEDQGLATRTEEGGKVPPHGITHFDSGMSCWFQCMPNLTDVSGVYVPEGVINLGATFQHCTKLESLEGRYGTFTIPSWVTTMHVMFGQTALKTLPTNFEIPSSILSLRATFYRCWQLAYLPQGFTVPANASVAYMFAYCSSLEAIPASFVVAGNSYGGDCLFLVVPGYEYKDAEGNLLATAPNDPVVTYYGGDLANLDPVTDASTATASHAVSTFAGWKRTLIDKNGLASVNRWLVNYVVPSAGGNGQATLDYLSLTGLDSVLSVPNAAIPEGYSPHWVYYKDNVIESENQKDFMPGATRASELSFDASRHAYVYLLYTSSEKDAKSASAYVDGEEYVISVPGYGRATGQLATVGNIGTAWWEVTAASPTAGYGTLRIWCEGGSTIASSNFASWGDWTADVEGAWGKQAVRRTVKAVFMEQGIQVEEDEGLAARTEDGGKVAPSGGTHFNSGMSCWFQCMPNLTDVSGAYVPEGVINLGATFQHCTKLESLEGRYGAFVIPSWVTTMHTMFSMSALKTLPTNFEIPTSVLSLRATFYKCWQLSYLPEGFTVPANVSVPFMFTDCPSLKTIPTSLVLAGSEYDCQNFLHITPGYEFRDDEGNLLATAPDDSVVTYYGGNLADLDPVADAASATAEHAVAAFANWHRTLIGKEELADENAFLVSLQVPNTGSDASGYAAYQQIATIENDYKIDISSILTPKGYSIDGWFYYDEDGTECAYDVTRAVNAQNPAIPGLADTRTATLYAHLVGPIVAIDMPIAQRQVNLEARMGSTTTSTEDISFRSFSTMKTNLIANVSANQQSLADLLDTLFMFSGGAGKQASLTMDIATSGDSVAGGVSSVDLATASASTPALCPIATLDPSGGINLPMSIAGTMTLDFGADEIEFVTQNATYSDLANIIWTVEPTV